MISKGWLALGFIVALVLIGMASAATTGMTGLSAQVTSKFEIGVTPANITSWTIDPASDNTYSPGTMPNMDVKANPHGATWYVKAATNTTAGKLISKGQPSTATTHPLRVQAAGTGSQGEKSLTTTPTAIYSSSSPAHVSSDLTYKLLGDYADPDYQDYLTVVIYTLTTSS